MNNLRITIAFLWQLFWIPDIWGPFLACALSWDTSWWVCDSCEPPAWNLPNVSALFSPKPESPLVWPWVWKCSVARQVDVILAKVWPEDLAKVWSEWEVRIIGGNVFWRGKKRCCTVESVMRNGIATPAKVRSEWECGLKWKCDPSENVIRNGNVILVEVWSEVEMRTVKVLSEWDCALMWKRVPSYRKCDPKWNCNLIENVIRSAIVIPSKVWSEVEL